jgi:hypothetical protein
MISQQVLKRPWIKMIDVCAQTATCTKTPILHVFVSYDSTESDITMELCTIHNKIMLLDNKDN